VCPFVNRVFFFLKSKVDVKFSTLTCGIAAGVGTKNWSDQTIMN
jgi:hypothetical protein